MPLASAASGSSASNNIPGSHSYRLIYFNGRGRAELARLCFIAADVSFEDIRYKATDNWTDDKHRTLSIIFI